MVCSRFVIMKAIEGDGSVFCVTSACNNGTCFIIKIKGKLACLQVTSVKGFVEGEACINSFCFFNGVIKGNVTWIQDFSVKDIEFITNFFNNRDLNTSGHSVIDDVFIRSFFFGHKVGVSACLFEGKVFEADTSVFIVSCCGKGSTLFITKVKGEFIVFEASTVKGFRQVKVDTSVFEFFDLVIKGCVFRINDA